jgi:molecular chaperone HtpG
VLVLDGVLDSHFINHLEQKLEKTQLKRVDSDTIDKLIAKDEKAASILSKEEEDAVKESFRKSYQ